VGNDGDRELLNLFRRHKIEPFKQGQSLGGFHERNGGARTGAELHARRLPGGRNEIDRVALEFDTHPHIFHRPFERDHFGH